MMPGREWKLSKGDHDEEEVDENRKEDGDCPQGVLGLKELPGKEEIRKSVHRGENGTKDNNLANCRLKMSLLRCS